MSWYIEEQSPVYLDFNSTTPLDPKVEDSIIGALKLWANPSSQSASARAAKSAIDTARTSLANLFHVTSKEVIFTSGGSEANNWIIRCVVEKALKKVGGSKPHVISSVIEHPSVLQPLLNLQNIGTIDLTLVTVDGTSGQVNLSEIEAAINENTCLLTIMLANNETGVIQPIRQISNIVIAAKKKYDSSIFIHTDAAQAVGKIDVNLNELKVDAVTVVGHKFYGPRIGALIIRSRNTVELSPLILGGGQEDGFRAGTENTPMIVGLGAAAQLCVGRIDTITSTLQTARDYFEEQLKVHLPEVHRVNFASSPRLPNTSSVLFHKYTGTSVELLQKCKSFTASTCAACHSGSVSSVLMSCGLSSEMAAKTVRFSFGRETTTAEIDRVIKELKAMLFFSKFGSSLMNAISKGPVAGF